MSAQDVPQWLNGGALALVGVLILACSAGVEDSTPENSALAPGDNGSFDDKVVVITTDYQSGSVAVLDLERDAVASDLLSIHPDSVGRMVGDVPVIIGRLGADNLLTLSPDDAFSPLSQFSVGNGTNPQDVIRVGDEIWVSLLEVPTVAIFDAGSGAQVGTVDLSAVADADGTPEATGMIRFGDQVFVALQRLDRDNGFVPTGPGVLAAINIPQRALVDLQPLTDEIEGIPLANPNPVDLLLRLPDGKAGVLTQGAYTTVGDGAIEVVELEPPYGRAVVATESQLGGSMTYFATGDGQTWFVIVNEAITPGTLDVATVLKAITPQGDVVELLRTEGYDLGDISVTAEGQLLVVDRRPAAAGVRVFDAGTFTELTTTPIPTGLSPFFLIPFDAPTEQAWAE